MKDAQNDDPVTVFAEQDQIREFSNPGETDVTKRGGELAWMRFDFVKTVVRGVTEPVAECR